MLYGVYEGFSDLKKYGYSCRLPKLVACEPNPRLELVLEKGKKHTDVFAGDTSETSSIGGATTTWQAEYALRTWTEEPVKFWGLWMPNLLTGFACLLLTLGVSSALYNKKDE